MMFSLVGVLLAVAFFTLMERKIMGLMHYRKGPNKVLTMGVSQPIADASKLLTKENLNMSAMKMVMFFMGPMTGMILMTLSWGWYDYVFNSMSNNMKLFTILAIMSLSAFIFLLTSWGSNTKYTMLGGYRAVAQVVSYEVCLVLFIMSIFYISNTYSLEKIKLIQENLWMGLFSLPFFMMWMTMCMAESNRTPFDMAEGESEIVSGFNIEYGGGLFALIFISEYGMIMFLSYLTSMLFLGGSYVMLKTFFICFVFVWVRSSLPRVRYDKLMYMSWKIALPYSLGLLMVCLMHY